MARAIFSPTKCVVLQQCDRESATFYSGVRLAVATETTTTTTDMATTVTATLPRKKDTT